MSLGKLVLRSTVGGLMLGHGLQKLKGSFGGPGLEGTEQMMKAIGMHPPKEQALAAALSETVGGALTASGFLSPLGPAMVTGVMTVAIQKVHGKNGIWTTAGGYEYNLTIIGAAFALAADGPGPISLDGILRRQRSGIGWAILATGMGVGMAFATLALSDRMAPAAEPGGLDVAEPATDPTIETETGIAKPDSV